MRNFNDPEYKKWRQFIRSRDKYKCQWPHCDKTKGIQVHHILPWQQYPGLRYHIDNGICLCKFHHNMIKNDETSYANLFLKILYNRKSQNNKTNGD
jgi:hypothetical protein